MRHLLNTLYVMTEEAWLSLDGENIVIQVEDRELGRFPLHGLEGSVMAGQVLPSWELVPNEG